MRWIKHGNRLGMYKQKADSTYWSDHWQNISIDELVAWTMKEDTLSSTFSLIKAFRRYLPAGGRIIEAGCGLGQWVKVLKELGYDIEGVDFSEETIKKVSDFDPALPVDVGDVLKLPYPDNYFAGYISLGVVEHFEEGPERALEEAYRVIEDEGTLLISVPYFSPLRKCKSRLGFYRNKKEGEFYQYAFPKQEFIHILEQMGFTLVSVIPYDAVKGLKDEITIFRWFYNFFGAKMAKDTIKRSVNKNEGKDKRKRTFILKELLGMIIQSYRLRYLTAHMILFVAKVRKEQDGDKWYKK